MVTARGYALVQCVATVTLHAVALLLIVSTVRGWLAIAEPSSGTPQHVVAPSICRCCSAAAAAAAARLRAEVRGRRSVALCIGLLCRERAMRGACLVLPIARHVVAPSVPQLLGRRRVPAARRQLLRIPPATTVLREARMRLGGVVRRLGGRGGGLVLVLRVPVLHGRRLLLGLRLLPRAGLLHGLLHGLRGQLLRLLVLVLQVWGLVLLLLLQMALLLLLLLLLLLHLLLLHLLLLHLLLLHLLLLHLLLLHLLLLHLLLLLLPREGVCAMVCALRARQPALVLLLLRRPAH